MRARRSGLYFFIAVLLVLNVISHGDTSWALMCQPPQAMSPQPAPIACVAAAAAGVTVLWPFCGGALML